MDSKKLCDKEKKLTDKDKRELIPFIFARDKAGKSRLSDRFT